MYKVDERIYNPFGDELISSTEYLLQKYSGRLDVYISFTKENKLGINPRSPYDTPIGIYTYPLHVILDRIIGLSGDVSKKIGSFVPFAGGNPWVWIVEPNISKGKFISDIAAHAVYSESDLNYDVEILHDLYSNEKAISTFAISYYVSHDLDDKEDIWNAIIKNWTKEARHKSAGGIFWNITRELSKIMSKGKPSIFWNKILRDDLGYVGIADLGEGIIHPSEPNQCVFFNRSGLNVLDKIENVARTGEVQDTIKDKDKDNLLSQVSVNIVRNDKPKYLKMMDDINYNELDKYDKDYLDHYLEYYIYEENPDDLDYIDMDKINDSLLEIIDEIVMDNIDSFGSAYSYGYDHPEQFIDEDSENENEGPTWSEEQREEAAHAAEMMEQDEHYREVKNEILGQSPSQLKSNYPSVYELITDMDYVDVPWLMRYWIGNLFLEDDWKTFLDEATPYFDDGDHVNFIDNVLLGI